MGSTRLSGCFWSSCALTGAAHAGWAIAPDWMIRHRRINPLGWRRQPYTVVVKDAPREERGPQATGIEHAYKTSLLLARTAAAPLRPLGQSLGLLDHLVRAQQHPLWDREPECFRSLQVDDRFELGWLFDRSPGLSTSQNLVHILRRVAIVAARSIP